MKIIADAYCIGGDTLRNTVGAAFCDVSMMVEIPVADYIPLRMTHELSDLPALENSAKSRFHQALANRIFVGQRNFSVSNWAQLLIFRDFPDLMMIHSRRSIGSGHAVKANADAIALCQRTR